MKAAVQIIRDISIQKFILHVMMIPLWYRVKDGKLADEIFGEMCGGIMDIKDVMISQDYKTIPDLYSIEGAGKSLRFRI